MKLHGSIVEASVMKDQLALAIKAEFNSSDKQTKEIINYVKGKVEPEDMNIETWELLYNHFSNEMPYGTQKARTGDPYQWIANKMNSMFGSL
jgi:hypothetical protein